MNKKKLQSELNNKKTIEDCAKSFGVMGDKTRLKICYLLCHYPKLSVGDMAKLLGLSISATSHSLKKLKELKIVKNHRDYKQVFYSFGNTKLTRYIKRSLI